MIVPDNSPPYRETDCMRVQTEQCHISEELETSMQPDPKIIW